MVGDGVVVHSLDAAPPVESKESLEDGRGDQNDGNGQTVDIRPTLGCHPDEEPKTRQTHHDSHADHGYCFILRNMHCGWNGKTKQKISLTSSNSYGQGPISLTIFCLQYKFGRNFALFQLLPTKLLQFFAQAMTAQLLCHVQNFVAITVLEAMWNLKQNLEITVVKWAPNLGICIIQYIYWEDLGHMV